jgi:hypothetical protein
LRLARLVGAAFVVVAAANHGRLAALGEGDVARHAIFVGLDLAFATILVLVPRWALIPAVPLTVQQMWSHGSDLVESVRGAGSVDWISALVVVFFPALLVLLVVERRTPTTTRV